MKHILCDVDGVVINGYHANPAKRVSWSRDLEKDLGIKQSDMENIFFLGPFVDVMQGRVGLVEALQSVCADLGYKGDVISLIRYWFEKDSNINHQFMDWVKSNNKFKFSLATNQEHLRAEYLWNELNFNEYFEDIYYAAKIGYKKPDLSFFKYIFENTKSAPSDFCLIDDCPKNVAAAISLGMQAIVFNDMDDVLNHPFLNEG
jgi:putative hydrolase of the HAD superfamily